MGVHGGPTFFGVLAACTDYAERLLATHTALFLATGVGVSPTAFVPNLTLPQVDDRKPSATDL